MQMSRDTKRSTQTKAESRAVGKWRCCVGPAVPGPGCLPVTHEALRMLSCNSGLGQKRYNARQLENTVCVIFLQMVMCLKPRLLTGKPGAPEIKEAPDVHVEVPVHEVGGLSPELSLAPLECSLPPGVNTLQILCLTLSCLSFSPRHSCYQEPLISRLGLGLHTRPCHFFGSCLFPH